MDRKPPNAFNRTKEMLSKNVLLTYPNFNKPFDVHTDSSDTQLGAVISQDNMLQYAHSEIKIER